jgi:GntR family transcriptional repressor for pyruvate dehydrogenase complex
MSSVTINIFCLPLASSRSLFDFIGWSIACWTISEPERPVLMSGKSKNWALKLLDISKPSTFLYGKRTFIKNSFDKDILISYPIIMLNKRIKLKKIQYTDKISLVSDLIQEYIVGGQLKVGMELPPEREFAQQLGVSRFSLREALRVAQVKGLIEITRGRKPRVAKPTTSAASEAISLILRRKENVFIELVEARQILECQIARLAASRVTNEQISRMRESIKRLEQDPDNIQLCVAKDFEFHEILIEAAGNRVIQIMLEPLSELLKESRFKTIQKKGINRAVTAHKAILCAINERDPDRASQEMHRHLKMAKEDLLLLSQFEDAEKL